jgi:hypothetical protein
MDFRLASIPGEFPAPLSCTEFDPQTMTAMFNEGYRQITEGTAWRTTPPALGPGEAPLVRSGTNLIFAPQGPPTPIHK